MGAFDPFDRGSCARDMGLLC